MFFNAKTLKSFALATVVFGLPAAAHADPVAFKRNGVSYEYTTSVENGRTVLTGTADRVPFRFVVHGRYVKGQYNFQPVTFLAPPAKRSNPAVAVR